ncbi:hypothetical protein HKH62_04980 [Vibrio cholerae]|uniref:hypothetical protein n=1 Tax=Vibrio cholerae TaxID=666 RepID=UPI001C92154F|nr:hypothetical protein [Vibrio cholerae]MBY3671919.1 hypothetical protein [Vibrio cholerae]
MSDEMKMSDVEKNIRASAVMDFVDMIRGAYDSGFIDNHPTNYDIYRSAQMHVKDRYGVETDNWDDELAKESRNDNHDRLTEENKKLREALEKTLSVVNRAAAMDDSDAKLVSRGVQKLLSELGGE